MRRTSSLSRCCSSSRVSSRRWAIIAASSASCSRGPRAVGVACTWQRPNAGRAHGMCAAQRAGVRAGVPAAAVSRARSPVRCPAKPGRRRRAAWRPGKCARGVSEARLAVRAAAPACSPAEAARAPPSNTQSTWHELQQLSHSRSRSRSRSTALVELRQLWPTVIGRGKFAAPERQS